ncbi:hypothetical protein [Streptomyces sp. CA-253872]|uniref:hypothetical protein n=1 Tax=Streptomyces sp. CA-253872 TaxID=3240067 RepID=UPI003D8C28E6
MSTSEEERAAFAALARHLAECLRCRDGAAACPETAAVYRVWRPTLTLTLSKEDHP